MKTWDTFARRMLIVSAIGALLASGCRGGAGGGGDGGTVTDVPGISQNRIVVGATAPLSGPTSANGTAAIGGYKAYFEAVNAQGGVTLSDGTTRKIKYVFHDDGYDPSRAVQNFQRLVQRDNVFALAPTFGTPTSLAVMERANQNKVPQVFVHTGDGVFSENQQTNPWTIGWAPTYEGEGRAYGQYLARQGEELTVAVLRQTGELGSSYVNGLKEGIQQSNGRVRIVATQTYEPTDPTVESQITNLAQSDADVLYLAVSVTKLAANALVSMREAGWDPNHVILARLSSSIAQVMRPANMMDADNLYSAGFTMAADNPQWKSDPDMQKFLSRMNKHSPEANPVVPNAVWGYAAAATFVEALKQMDPISRKGLMDAVDQLRLQPQDIPLLLQGVNFNASSETEPPVQGLRLMRFQDRQWNLLEGTGQQ